MLIYGSRAVVLPWHWRLRVWMMRVVRFLRYRSGFIAVSLWLHFFLWLGFVVWVRRPTEPLVSKPATRVIYVEAVRGMALGRDAVKKATVRHPDAKFATPDRTAKAVSRQRQLSSPDRRVARMDRRVVTSPQAVATEQGELSKRSLQPSGYDRKSARPPRLWERPHSYEETVQRWLSQHQRHLQALLPLGRPSKLSMMVVRVTIDSAGLLAGIAVEKTSGTPEIDRLVVEWIRAMDHFPAPSRADMGPANFVQLLLPMRV
jgi:TonB family protein